MKYRSLLSSLLVALGTLAGASTPAAAQQLNERLCDPAYEDCRSQLIQLMDAEPQAMDIAFWFMEDARYTAAIERAVRRGVRVRVLIDPRANSQYPLNAQRLAEIQGDGVPMRKYIGSSILHWKMMLFRGLGVVEFSGANYSSDALRYDAATGPYVNYVDEVIYFTNEASIVNSFREKFDDFWVDTVKWANYANITGPLMREEPDNTYPQDPQLNFPPEQNYRTRALSRYSAARLDSQGRGLDVIMYRITDVRHTDAMIALEQRGVPVRLITEQAQYRLVDRMWHSWNVDRLYMAGVEVRDRAHAGLNHQKSVIIYDQDAAAGDQPLVFFGSSNWTSPSANGQVEHNIFTTKPTLVSWMIDQFNRKWNNLAPVDETKPFVPLPPDTPKSPSPANFASNVDPATVLLRWNGGPFAHLYDIQIATDPNFNNVVFSSSHATDVNLREQSNKSETSAFPDPKNSPGYALPAGLLQGGTTYYWRVVGYTMALIPKAGPVWSFTTTGTTPPPPPPAQGDIVLYASASTSVHGGWRLENDTSAAGGSKLRHPNANAAKLSAPLANPTHYFELTFNAEANRPYHLWLRGRADTSSPYNNDSVFVQFSGSVTSSGAATWRIGTTSATDVNLENCSGCGQSGWGWQDNGWGSPTAMGPHVYFATTGQQTIRIQTREDGFSIDQVVLSPSTYLTTAPGPQRNDSTILAASGETPPPPPPPPPTGGGNVVLYASEAPIRSGGWIVETDSTAAGSSKLRHPNAGAAKLSAALANPTHFFQMTFNAEAGKAYRIWIRGKADSNYWGNDSLFIQFNGSVNASGTAIWRIGSTSAAEYNLEDCSGCGLSNWGWQDNGWGVGVMGPLVHFATTGQQTIRIQTREDGLSVDQIVLSSDTYLNAPPGPLKNDNTMLQKTQ
jgi:phosphatidylserine/phosphatidylglycerophosphate/cardiolipin synthase-like enzyme